MLAAKQPFASERLSFRLAPNFNENFIVIKTPTASASCAVPLS
jgi:hypothetical protein